MGKQKIEWPWGGANRSQEKNKTERCGKGKGREEEY
jgi:hypothetical protein